MTMFLGMVGQKCEVISKCTEAKCETPIRLGQELGTGPEGCDQRRRRLPPSIRLDSSTTKSFDVFPGKPDISIRNSGTFCWYDSSLAQPPRRLHGKEQSPQCSHYMLITAQNNSKKADVGWNSSSHEIPPIWHKCATLKLGDFEGNYKKNISILGQFESH